ncbi:putative carbonic anhydrase 3 [Photinus pyralis]|nr:putative carbonic anhydrase 3 [Photinus pyralis]
MPLNLKAPLTSVPYEFNHIHFHWGDGEDNNKGSEHYVNGHFYPLEMHAVHTQSVSNTTDKFLVVAYLFQLSRQKNPVMEKIVDAILDATINGNGTVENFKLINLLYNIPFSYFTYEGSLTTPPYTESVVFLVAATHFPITKHQLEAFQQAASINPGLRNNYRCLQDTNHRKVMHVLLPSYL